MYYIELLNLLEKRSFKIIISFKFYLESIKELNFLFTHKVIPLKNNPCLAISHRSLVTKNSSYSSQPHEKQGFSNKTYSPEKEVFEKNKREIRRNLSKMKFFKIWFSIF